MVSDKGEDLITGLNRFFVPDKNGEAVVTFFGQNALHQHNAEPGH